MKDRTKMPRLLVIAFALITLFFLLFSISSYLVSFGLTARQEATRG